MVAAIQLKTLPRPTSHPVMDSWSSTFSPINFLMRFLVKRWAQYIGIPGEPENFVILVVQL